MAASLYRTLPAEISRPSAHVITTLRGHGSIHGRAVALRTKTAVVRAASVAMDAAGLVVLAEIRLERKALTAVFAHMLPR